MDLSDFFSTTKPEEYKILDGGGGINDDVARWIRLYRAHLIGSGKSNATSDNYNVVLNAFEAFIGRYHSDLSGISSLTIDSHINAFLLYMEDYQVSKKYGSLKERIDYLLLFIKTYSIKTTEHYNASIEEYFTDMDDQLIDINEYVLYDFQKYIMDYGVIDIVKSTISEYIGSRPKVKTSTMVQRRISIIAFLRFIDKSIGYEHFEKELWRLKHYKVTKLFNQLKTGFSNADVQKITPLLLSSPHATIENLKKKKYNSLLVEYRTRAMMLLMMHAGLRVSEALALKYSDITESKDGKTYSLQVFGKGNKIRRVPIVKAIFEPYLTYLSDNRVGDYLSSTSRFGKPQNRINLYNMIKSKLINAGVSQFGLHIFRHHFGSSFASENGNMKVLQQILGHNSIKTTMIYSEIDDHEIARHVSTLENYLKGGEYHENLG